MSWNLNPMFLNPDTQVTTFLVFFFCCLFYLFISLEIVIFAVQVRNMAQILVHKEAVRPSIFKDGLAENLKKISWQLLFTPLILLLARPLWKLNFQNRIETVFRN